MKALINKLIQQDKPTIMTEDAEAKADDSDCYYTPEDPHTTILSPVKSPAAPLEKVELKAEESVAQWFKLFAILEGYCEANQGHWTARQSNQRQLAGIIKKWRKLQLQLFHAPIAFIRTHRRQLRRKGQRPGQDLIAVTVRSVLFRTLRIFVIN